MNARLAAVAATVALDGSRYSVAYLLHPRTGQTLVRERGVRLGRLKLVIARPLRGEALEPVFLDRPAPCDPARGGLYILDRVPPDSAAARLMQARFPACRIATLASPKETAR